MRIARRRVGAALLPIFAPATLGCLARTWRVQRSGSEHLDHVLGHSGRILTLWHGRMLLPLPAHRNSGFTVLVSPSDDGSLVHELLRRFGCATIRGSSNKQPMRALRKMLDELGRGGTVVITPDGPRGPRHSVNPGPAWMARETGFPILPMGCVCDRAWRFNSWDRFTIPRPGARVVIRYAEPLVVASDADEDELRRVTSELGRRMLAAELESLQGLGCAPDW